MQHPERARDIASTAIGCVVTKEEHEQLTRVTREQPHLRGWDRYTAAGITSFAERNLIGNRRA